MNSCLSWVSKMRVDVLLGLDSLSLYAFHRSLVLILMEQIVPVFHFKGIFDPWTNGGEIPY